MKRIVLFIATNLAVVLVLSVAASLLGVNRFLTANGLQFGTLLAFAALMGFGGAFISLWMSKPIAKWMHSGRGDPSRPQNELEHWFVNTVARLRTSSQYSDAEVAIYDGEPNAFATGPSKSNALVAVSTGLLQMMDRREAEAVIAHEVAHVANGDMVTLTLIQGVVNTFVIFISRVIGYAVDQFLRKGDQEQQGPGIAYTITSIVCEILFGILRAWWLPTSQDSANSEQTLMRRA
jgi:heat shock protein HtpX